MDMLLGAAVSSGLAEVQHLGQGLSSVAPQLNVLAAVGPLRLPGTLEGTGQDVGCF